MIDPACAGAVAALEHDPFYACISAELGADAARRRAALAQYFDYSIRQGTRIGRVARPADATQGVAVWTLPQTSEVSERERQLKEAFLRATLGERGYRDYQRIVRYMSQHAATVVGSDCWYLSIVAVAPEAQGRGLGTRLLAPTLAQADAAGVTSYLETFGRRTLGFYGRLGFVACAEFHEPTTQARYTLMVRGSPLAENASRPARRDSRSTSA
jgi:GNAT superfamily N-acetyltransferase